MSKIKLGCLMLLGFFFFSGNPDTNKYNVSNEENALINPVVVVVCDDDGFADISITNIEIEVLQSYNDSGTNIEEEVVISTSFGHIIKLGNLTSGTVTTEIICDTPGVPLSDIAVDENRVIYVTNFNSIGILDETNCTTSVVPDLSALQPTNSLSFDIQGNLYFGGQNSSNVLRYDSDELTPPYIWQNFGSGSPSGDFVILGDKMYISWSLGENVRLYEVTIDDDFNYVSHVDLGAILPDTFGLASELGQLYGVTTGELYRINLDTFTLTTVAINNFENGAWFGAAGLHEAFGFVASTHLSQEDANNNANPLPNIWSNTQQGAQTVYVRVENINTGVVEVVEVNIVIGTTPDITTPSGLTKCDDGNSNTTFDLTEVETALLQNVTVPVTVTYYNSENEALTDTNPIDANYTTTLNQETIYVRVQNIENNCFDVTQFTIEVVAAPTIEPMVNSSNARVLTDCYIDAMGDGFFNLNDAYMLIIPENVNYAVEFFLSEDDAEQGINTIAPIFYAINNMQEIFVSVTNNNGCKSITNFFVNSDCYDSVTDITNISFPAFFTPNNDAANDTWNVRGISTRVQQTSIMYIFDRYGKLLYYFRPAQIQGWDGTYRGRLMPSSDYWYKFETAEGQTFSGSFSLIR